MGGLGKDHQKLHCVVLVFYYWCFIIDVLSPFPSWIKRGSLESLVNN